MSLNDRLKGFIAPDYMGRSLRTMPTVPESADDNRSIIDGRQKRIIRVIEYILTILGWTYIAVYLSVIIYGATASLAGLPIPHIRIYNSEMLSATRELFRIWFTSILVIILVELCWKEYNRIRYGDLDRREMPADTTDEEMAAVFGITPGDVAILREQKIIDFDDNVI